MFTLKRFVRLNRPQPLSPVWEAFITGIWQSTYQRRLQIEKARGEQTFDLEWGVKAHPFNLTQGKASLARAQDFIDTLEVIHGVQQSRERFESISQGWWPQDAADLIDALKREQELKEEERDWGGSLGATDSLVKAPQQAHNDSSPSGGTVEEGERSQRRCLE